jgi:hypothetical protein
MPLPSNLHEHGQRWLVATWQVLHLLARQRGRPDIWGRRSNMNPILNTLLSLCVGLGAASFVVAQEAAKPAKADKPVAAEKSAKAEKPVTGCCCQAACTPVVAAAQEPKAKAKGDAAAPRCWAGRCRPGGRRPGRASQGCREGRREGWRVLRHDACRVAREGCREGWRVLRHDTCRVAREGCREGRRVLRHDACRFACEGRREGR